MSEKKRNWVRIPSEVVETVLCQSRRRCCFCYFLDGDKSVKKGQLAHIDRNPANSEEDNIAYLCFKHHDQYDAKHSQSKGFTIEELRNYKKCLYKELGTTEARWEINIQGTLKDHDTKKIQEIVTALSSIAGLEISLKSVREGSVIIQLESEAIAYCRIMKAFRMGLLSKALNASVERVSLLKNQKVYSLTSKGQQLLNEKKYKDAVEYFNQAIEIDPSYAATWSGKTSGLLELYRLEDMGKEDMKRLMDSYSCSCLALDLCNDNASLWANKGAVLVELGQDVEALDCFDRAIKLDPKNAFAWYNKGTLLYNMGRFHEAIEILEMALKLGDKLAIEALRIARAKVKKHQD